MASQLGQVQPGSQNVERYGGLVERSRISAAEQLTDPMTHIRFLQGKGQVNGISLSSLYRRSVLDGSAPMFVRKQPENMFLFQKRQQAKNWTSSMNTQDQHQKIHVPVGDGGDTSVDILDQAIKDASATPCLLYTSDAADE